MECALYFCPSEPSLYPYLPAMGAQSARCDQLIQTSIDAYCFTGKAHTSSLSLSLTLALHAHPHTYTHTLFVHLNSPNGVTLGHANPHDRSK